MLEYMADTMEDAKDFSWMSAKASHAVVLCRMEDRKLTWGDTPALDRIRRANAQKMIGSSQNGSASGNTWSATKQNGLVCKFYQNGPCTCADTRNHTTGRRRYKHTCNICHRPHTAKDCKNGQTKSAKKE